MEPIDDWWDERWINGDDSKIPMAAHLDRVRPKPINAIERATTKSTFCHAHNEPCSCCEFIDDTVEALGHDSEDEDSGLSNHRPSRYERRLTVQPVYQQIPSTEQPMKKAWQEAKNKREIRPGYSENRILGALRIQSGWQPT